MVVIAVAEALVVVAVVVVKVKLSQEGSRKLRLPDYLTTARYGGRLPALRTGRLCPQEYSWYSFSLGTESTPEPWFGRKEI